MNKLPPEIKGRINAADFADKLGYPGEGDVALQLRQFFAQCIDAARERADKRHQQLVFPKVLTETKEGWRPCAQVVDIVGETALVLTELRAGTETPVSGTYQIVTAETDGIHGDISYTLEQALEGDTVE